MKAHQSFRLSAVLCFANGFLVIEYRLRVGGFGHVSGPHVRSITGIQARAYGKVVVGEGGPQIPPRIFELLSRIVQVDRSAPHGQPATWHSAIRMTSLPTASICHDNQIVSETFKFTRDVQINGVAFTSATFRQEGPCHLDLRRSLLSSRAALAFSRLPLFSPASWNLAPTPGTWPFISSR